MARLVIRNLDADLEADLRERAERHGRSLEDEVRDILCDAVKDEDFPTEGFGTRIANRFKGIGLKEDEEIHEWRGHPVRPADFDA